MPIKHFKKPQTRPKIFICLLDHADEGPLANIKIERQRRQGKLLIQGRSRTQYVAMVGKLVYSLWNTHSKILLQRIKHFRYKSVKISLFIIADQNSVEFVTSSLC